ncbi:MAG: hypothetical protein IJ333_00720 [Clostridia bacterium]|nr:hypothetical protein [Clostridia bacterium]
MKKNIVCFITLLLMGSLLLTGCSPKLPTFKPAEKIADLSTTAGEESQSLTQIIHTGDYWYTLTQEESSGNRTLSVGPSLSETKAFYLMTNNTIHGFTAQGDHAVWCEQIAETNNLRYMVYDRVSNRVSSISTVELPAAMTCLPKIGLFNGVVYYFELDTKENALLMKEFQTQTGQFRTFYAFPSCNLNNPFHYISMEAERINVVLNSTENEPKLVSFNPSALEAKHIINLPTVIDKIFSVSYDTVSSAYAIGYYSDDYEVETKEYVAMLTPDPAQFDVEFCISEIGTCISEFIYKDSLLYYINQREPTFSDKTVYSLIEYDYKNASVRVVNDFIDCSLNNGVLYGIMAEDSDLEKRSLWKVL